MATDMSMKAVVAVVGIVLTTSALYAAFEDARFSGGTYDGHDRGAIGSYPLTTWDPDYREERFAGGTYDGHDRGAIGSYPLMTWDPDYRDGRFAGGTHDGFDADDYGAVSLLWDPVGSLFLFR